MARTMEKTKAVTKVLVGTLVISFIGGAFAVPVVIFLGMGIVAIAAGMIIMIVAAALGAWIGGLWAGKNITEKAVAKKISIWAASLFLTVNVFLLAGDAVITVAYGKKVEGLLIQALQVAAQSFLVYAVSYVGIRRNLIKREEKG